jgi:glycine cleavage system H protein
MRGYPIAIGNAERKVIKHMAVLLVLATFLVFLIIDWVLNRKKAVTVQAESGESQGTPLLSSASVDGILVPDQLRYHPGHTWCREERRQLVRIGADALAASVIPTPDRIELPKPGHWLRQGQRAWSLYSGSQRINMVSPAEGEVVEVNPEVIRRPDLLKTDPYGKGWLLRVSVPDPESTERNLLPQSLVRAWMKEAVRSVRARNRAVGKVMVAGGGTATVELDSETLPALMKEVFLT